MKKTWIHHLSTVHSSIDEIIRAIQVKELSPNARNRAGMTPLKIALMQARNVDDLENIFALKLCGATIDEDFKEFAVTRYLEKWRQCESLIEAEKMRQIINKPPTHDDTPTPGGRLEFLDS